VLKRIGIQDSALPPGRLYLLQCPRCGSCVTTYSLRRHRRRPNPMGAFAAASVGPPADVLAARPR